MDIEDLIAEGQRLLSQMKFEEAAATFDAALAADPANPILLASRGSFHRRDPSSRGGLRGPVAAHPRFAPPLSPEDCGVPRIPRTSVRRTNGAEKCGTFERHEEGRALWKSMT